MKSPVSTKKKEKLHHPDSRKAGQLVRKQLRKGKLDTAASKRRKTYYSQVDLYGFFYYAMPESGVLTLEEIHVLMRDLWLTRHDEDLDEERAARRKGRPKSTKEVKLEETKLRELELYRTGMEVPDLTHAANVELFRRWDQKELAFTQLLRFIRISSTNPELAVVSRPGKHSSLVAVETEPSQDSEMNVDVAETTAVPQPPWPSLFSDVPGRLGPGSTMLNMDGPL